MKRGHSYNGLIVKLSKCILNGRNIEVYNNFLNSVLLIVFKIKLKRK